MKNEWDLFMAITKQMKNQNSLQLRIKGFASSPLEPFAGIVEDKQGEIYDLYQDEFEIITQILKEDYDLTLLVNYNLSSIEILTQKAMDDMPF